MINYNRINPLKREYIEKLANNKVLQQNCKALYIFGSTVEGCSNKIHTKDSDVDIAIVPIDANIDSLRNNLIHDVISNTLWKKDKILYDIIWIDDNVKKNNVYKNILKGEQII